MGGTFLLNIGKFPPDYTESDPRSFVITAVITSCLKVVASPAEESRGKSFAVLQPRPGCGEGVWEDSCTAICSLFCGVDWSRGQGG
jgi:hypothetical protein